MNRPAALVELLNPGVRMICHDLMRDGEMDPGADYDLTADMLTDSILFGIKTPSGRWASETIMPNHCRPTALSVRDMREKIRRMAWLAGPKNASCGRPEPAKYGW